MAKPLSTIMPTETIQTVSQVDKIPDLSLWGLFMQADWLVKGVMILLVMASLWCWTIVFEKFKQMRRLKKLSDQFEESFWSGNSLDYLYQRISSEVSDPMSAIFISGMREWKHSIDKGLTKTEEMKASLRQRLERSMSVTIDKEMSLLEKSMVFLASVGSTAPFMGLFGTVWGIMNSFQAIAVTKNTSLSVVAPGIAEALLATALGLVAAIPAVVFYNKFSTDIARYAARLETFASEFSSILSRHLEELK